MVVVVVILAPGGTFCEHTFQSGSQNCARLAPLASCDFREETLPSVSLKISLFAALSLHPVRSGITQLGSENSCDTTAKPTGEATVLAGPKTTRETGPETGTDLWIAGLPFSAVTSVSVARKTAATMRQITNHIELPSCQTPQRWHIQKQTLSPNKSRAQQPRCPTQQQRAAHPTFTPIRKHRERRGLFRAALSILRDAY